MTTTERAAEIRKALKSKGWTSKDVGVRSHLYSMGSSIYVTIKNPTIPKSVVTDIAKSHERIDRDHFGEILSGCNRYVSVSYSDDALKALGAQWLSAVTEAINQLEPDNDHSIIPVGGTKYGISRTSSGNYYSVWGDSHIAQVTDADEAARVIAVNVLNDSVNA